MRRERAPATRTGAPAHAAGCRPQPQQDRGLGAPRCFRDTRSSIIRNRLWWVAPFPSSGVGTLPLQSGSGVTHPTSRVPAAARPGAFPVGVVVMTLRTARACRVFAWTPVGSPSRDPRLLRGAQWLLAALLLCEWRYPAPAVLQSEQRSARSALSVHRCRSKASPSKASPCVAGRSASGAWRDSLTYLSFDEDGTSAIRRWPDDGLPITVWIGESGRSALARRRTASHRPRRLPLVGRGRRAGAVQLRVGLGRRDGARDLAPSAPRPPRRPGDAPDRRRGLAPERRRRAERAQHPGGSAGHGDAARPWRCTRWVTSSDSSTAPMSGTSWRRGWWPGRSRNATARR